MMLDRRRLLFGVGGFCAVLAATLLYLIFAPLPDMELPRVPVPRKPHPLLETLSITLPVPDAFADINARPMFSPDRKAIAEQAGGGATGAAPPSIALVGVILDSQDKMALIRTSASPLAGAFRLGANISGWQVTEIAADHIVLSAGPAREEVRLQDNRATKPIGATPPPMTAQ